MTRTVIDVDDELLAEAQEHFGTATKVATVNAALLEAVKLSRRRAFARAIAAGEFDLLEREPRDGAE